MRGLGVSWPMRNSSPPLIRHRPAHTSDYSDSSPTQMGLFSYPDAGNCVITRGKKCRPGPGIGIYKVLRGRDEAFEFYLRCGRA